MIRFKFQMFDGFVSLPPRPYCQCKNGFDADVGEAHTSVGYTEAFELS